VLPVFTYLVDVERNRSIEKKKRNVKKRRPENSKKQKRETNTTRKEKPKRLLGDHSKNLKIDAEKLKDLKKS
jgi:hypothetical protein